MSFVKDEIYFIQDSLSKKIKIGYSANFKRRFLDLSNANANRLYILCVLPGNKEDEVKYHARFAQYRTHGEWFSPSREIVEFIKEENRKIDKINKSKEESIIPSIDDPERYRLYSITEVARILNISRARFYQLQKNGFFPEAKYIKKTNKPYFTQDMVEQVKQVMITNIGINGEVCMFYSPRGAK